MEIRNSISSIGASSTRRCQGGVPAVLPLMLQGLEVSAAPALLPWELQVQEAPTVKTVFLREEKKKKHLY